MVDYYENKIISIGLVLVLLLTFSSFVFADFASSSLNVSQVGKL